MKYNIDQSEGSMTNQHLPPVVTQAESNLRHPGSGYEPSEISLAAVRAE